jgi:Lytic transglycolase
MATKTKLLGPYLCLTLLLAATTSVHAPVICASPHSLPDPVSIPSKSNKAPSAKRLRPILSWYAVAGWYGERFDGRQTASGETFDMYALTAAHLTLPLGSIVRISYPRTGRSVLARINDRGPFVEGRGLDVSYQIAKWLGFEQRGIARVRIELLKTPVNRWDDGPSKD